MDLPDPALVFLIGPAGAGKSTWAEARYLSQEIVSSDRLRATVGSGEADLDASGDAFDLVRRIVAARVGRRLTTVIDTIGLDADLRRWARALADEHDVSSVVVLFETPLATCRSRNRERSRPVPVRVLDGQHRRVGDVHDELSEEAWERVVRVTGVDEAGGVATADRPPSPVQESGRTLDFVLHVSRFEWDPPLGSTLADIAREAEVAGFSGISVMDHLVQIPQVGRAWEDMPEALGTIGFLLGVTGSIEVGPLVLNATLRNPALTANALASLDAVSGGRLFCGIGAGWHDAEEIAYGYLPSTTRQRLDRLEDAIRLFPLMWGKGSATFEGTTAGVTDAMCYPRPAHPIRLIVGGGGEHRTLRIAARYADAINLVGGVDVVRRKLPVLRRHCIDVGRDPGEVDVTVLDTALLGADRRAVNDLVERHRGRTSAAVYRSRVGTGTREQLVSRYSELADAGVTTVFVTMPNLAGPADVESFGAVIAACDASTPPGPAEGLRRT